MTVISAQSIQVTICPPPGVDQNGLILSYIVAYTGDPFGAYAQSVTVNVLLSYPATACINTNLTGLEEFNNYTVTIRAQNSIGISSFSTGLTAQTNAAGKYSMSWVVGHRSLVELSLQKFNYLTGNRKIYTFGIINCRFYTSFSNFVGICLNA